MIKGRVTCEMSGKTSNEKVHIRIKLKMNEIDEGKSLNQIVGEIRMQWKRQMSDEGERLAKLHIK